jgi:hypothetical protein
MEFSSKCLTFEDGTHKLPQSVSKYQTALRNNPEERRSHLDRSGSLKSRTVPGALSRLVKRPGRDADQSISHPIYCQA